jgi:hypothetical protein
MEEGGLRSDEGKMGGQESGRQEEIVKFSNSCMAQ